MFLAREKKLETVENLGGSDSEVGQALGLRRALSPPPGGTGFSLWTQSQPVRPLQYPSPSFVYICR